MTRFAGRRWILRSITTVLTTAVGLLLLSAILPGFALDGWAAALVMALVVGVVNALVWPLIIRFALPFTVLTLGLGVLVLNGLVVLAAAQLMDDSEGTDLVDIDNVWTGIAVALGLTIVSTIVTSLLALDDDEAFHRNVVQREARRRGAITSEVPAVVFLEIDGLAHDVLLRAIRDGNAPTMARWLREGTHRLIPWETDWSSQTGASQIGLLHGDNTDIPAFRWWDKSLGKAVASSAPRDVMALEDRVSNGRGLLYRDGASRANMFSGDAPHCLLTISTVLRRRGEGRLGHDYYAYFASPYQVTRTFMLAVSDIVIELWEATQQKRADVQPRVHRGLKYSVLRAWMTVIQRDLQVQAVLGDVLAGRPVVYTTFSGYDEVAHHSGIERHDALTVLRKLDRQFARLEAAAAQAPRPVRFVVLSDHGQTQGATFLQRYGLTLEDVVTQACDDAHVEAAPEGEEDWTFVGASVTEAAQGDGALARGLDRATRARREDGVVVLGPQADDDAPGEDGLPEVVVMASGCLGLISFPREPGRVTLEGIEALHPSLIPALRHHPGIGFLMVRSEAEGALVIGARGTHRLADGHVTGEDPLAPFGPGSAAKVARTDGFTNCPDVLINGTYLPETEETTAFEELVGSHGGMGGTQEHPFALVPRDWEPPEEPIVGAGTLHLHLRSWLAAVGQEGYRDDPGTPGSGSGAAPEGERLTG